MHVAAINPQFLSADDVPAEQVAQGARDLRRAGRSRPEDAGKPAEIVDKIVEGKVRKWLGEITLLGQPFVQGRQAVASAST